MNNLKHVGRIKHNGRKVLVAYRTLPGDSDSALVIQTQSLSPSHHDSIIKLVESPAGQNSYEFAEVLARARFPEGGVMLTTLHYEKKLVKVKTSDIEMTPNVQSVVSLDQLNQLIAESKGVSVNDLAIGNQSSVQEVGTIDNLASATPIDEITQPVDETPLSDEDKAKRLRSDAARLFKEAARMREEAELLVPTKKKPVVIQ